MSNDVLAGLHRLERAVLPHLLRKSSLTDLVASSGLKEVEVTRALTWLNSKKLVVLSEEFHEIAHLDKNGIAYKEKGLPEVRFLSAIKDKPGKIEVVMKRAIINKNEAGVSIGFLRRNNYIQVTTNKEFQITELGIDLLKKGFTETALIEKLPCKVLDLSVTETNSLEVLSKRKFIIKKNIERKLNARLTEYGKKIAASKQLTNDVTDRLTPDMIKNRKWGKLRSYNLNAQVPRLHIGKKQPYRQFLDELRTKFLSIGFEEMTGPIIESEFWNMDALFMPQFHSARDIHDAYYVKSPTHAKGLPKKLVDNVKNAHERGIKGSKGWRYNFDISKTSRLILRSHDTAISARTLASKDLKIPGKYFQIARCFRRDVIDATHNADFDQIGGFVVAKGLNLKHLFGLLRVFAREFCGTDKIRVVPSYFPFTEPSVGLYAKHPDMGWMELAGAGIFRPEMCQPLGVDEPVIAWGIGLGRVAMFNLGIKDIRELYSHDLNYLRNARVI